MQRGSGLQWPELQWPEPVLVLLDSIFACLFVLSVCLFAQLERNRDWLFIKVGLSGGLDQDGRRQQPVLLTARLCRYLP